MLSETAGGPSGVGTVYELALDGTLTVLHSFSGSDGVFPFDEGTTKSAFFKLK